MMRSRVLIPPRLTSWTSPPITDQPARIILHLLLSFVTAVHSTQTLKAQGETRYYSMTKPHCNGVFRNVPAILLEGGGSLGKVPTPCDITLVTPSDYFKWMLRFERAVIQDCSVVVTIFESSINPTNRPPLLTMGCADTDPGIVYVNSSSITIRLQHRNAFDYTFRIAITAIASDSKCSQFQCANGSCVSWSIVCDRVDNCFDGSDELRNGTSQCNGSTWPLQGENWGVLASVLGVALVIGFMAACCRHIKRKRNSSIDDLYDLNAGPYVHKYAYRYAIIRPPKKPNKTNVVLGRDGHMHYTSTNV